MARRDTSPTDPAVAAWGDPAVVARCGVAALGPTDTECVEVDGVGLGPASPQRTAPGSPRSAPTPPSRCSSPPTYDPAPLLLPAFSAVAKALPPNGLRCR